MEPNQNQTTDTTLVQTTPPTSQENTSNPMTPEIENDTIMGVLSYLGPLVIIPYMAALDNPFVKLRII